ncbi:protein far1-related sequence 5-like [Gigaspora margarita]|uniref:Protein far1-related sequence 5-like n=1 Tax=Gigaspora margarita TaxID=4874 RepID=A0A8H3X331_GIGMA|nr:protein far1-related sequence 5-like [Gigaspora margarita]
MGSYDGIKNNRYGEIENDNNLRFENDIEGELGIELEKDTEDESGIEREKDTEDGSGIEFEEDIDIISESDDASKGTDNYQRGHLPPIRIEIYCGKIFGTWEECQEILERYARQNNFAIRKKQVDNSRDPRQHTWDCERSGKYVSRKTAPPEKQRNKGSKRIGCPFLVNACKSKGSDNEAIIKLTSMNLEHKSTVNERTQLHILFNQIESCVAEEQFAGRLATWHKKSSTYMTPSVPGRLFPNIYNILQKYITPKILQLHIDQMNEAVMYHSKRVNFENLYNLTLEVVDNGLIEFEYDSRQIRFDELLKGVDHCLIAEVWKIQSIEHKSNIGHNVVLLKNGFHLCTCILLFDSGVICRHWFCVLLQSEKAYFHISLIPRRWYKDEFMDTVVVDEPFLRRKSLEKNSLILSLPSFPDVADSWNTMLIEAPVQTVAKAIGCKQSIKGTLLGLARKYVEVVNYDNLNDSKILMEIFKEWIRIHEEAQCNKQIIGQELDDNQNVESDQNTESDQETESNQDTENDQDIETIQLDVQNPFKYIGKGRPSKKRIKSAIEKPKKRTCTSSRASRHCSICKSKEHDKRNCPNK